MVQISWHCERYSKHKAFIIINKANKIHKHKHQKCIHADLFTADTIYLWPCYCSLLLCDRQSRRLSTWEWGHSSRVHYHSWCCERAFTIFKIPNIIHIHNELWPGKLQICIIPKLVSTVHNSKHQNGDQYNALRIHQAFKYQVIHFAQIAGLYGNAAAKWWLQIERVAGLLINVSSNCGQGVGGWCRFATALASVHKQNLARVNFASLVSPSVLMLSACLILILAYSAAQFCAYSWPCACYSTSVACISSWWTMKAH